MQQIADLLNRARMVAAAVLVLCLVSLLFAVSVRAAPWFSDDDLCDLGNTNVSPCWIPLEPRGDVHEVPAPGTALLIVPGLAWIMRRRVKR